MTPTVAAEALGSELIGHWIGGRAVAGASDQPGDVYNPATGEVIRRVAMASPADVDAAVRSAASAFPDWSGMPPLKRSRLLGRFKDLLERNLDLLARVITEEHGKTLADAAGEVQRGLEVVEFALAVPHIAKGEVSWNVAAGVDTVSMRQPLGVCVGITPFNFPAMVPMWMFPVALACGNTFVLKPSEKDPSAANLLAAWLQEAGVPDGVFNVVHGDHQAATALLEHPQVAAVSFVGSTPVAESVYRIASQNGKRVQALGGAKNHMIVLPDADTDAVVEALTGSAFGSAGERCMAVSVGGLVGSGTAQRVLPKLAERIRDLRVGPGTDPQTEMGPLVTRDHRERVMRYIAAGTEAGAALLVDGRSHPLCRQPGFFLGGSLFDGVQPGMSIYRDEIFGPVLSMMRIASLEEAIALVNDHEYGNGVALFTNDGRAAREFTASVQVGMVGINVPIPVPAAFHSFGGWKRSLFGDQHVYGPEGIRFYTRLKAVTSRWSLGVKRAEFVIPHAQAQS